MEMKFETTRIQTNENVTFRFVVSMLGPGMRPTMRNAPRRMAIANEPGTPKATVGMSAPPSFELADAPGASTPSTRPVPNSSGRGELCTAWAYETH